MTKSYHSGFDYFTPDPGKHKSMNCKACNEEMHVERNVDYRQGGPWGLHHKSAVRKIDEFTCNNAGKPWHDQVIALRRFQRDTPSNTLATLVEGEIKEIIKTKLSTKNNYF